MINTKRFSLVLVIAFGLALPSLAQAFCGFYVGGADTKVYNNATMVTLMRDGKTTVLSMGNNYQGPPEDFAMVVPVPVVLQKDNVKILPKEVFARLDKMSAPRLVEYWEQDPCPKPIGLGGYGTIGHGSGTGSGYGTGGGGWGYGIADTTVVVEAKFAVGEYEIVILSAEDATGLERWLTQEGYKIPSGAAPFLRPYVEQGSKFFVAKVNPSKVTFKDGMAKLSPLRFHYESDDFSLPVRLGLINAKDKQDLIVHILAKNKRYELANYKNITIPTNLFVKDEVRERFGEFYAALFDATQEKNPGAVVTEYAWAASSCDPCPEPTLTLEELKTLGQDVIDDKNLVESLRASSSGARPSVTPGGPQGAIGGPPSGQLGRPPRAIVRAGAVKVIGSLDQNSVRRYVRRKMPRLRACYEAGLAANAKLSGLVVANFVIDKEGMVSKSKVTGVGNKKLTTCFAAAIGAIKFPKPPDGKKVRVQQPIQLRTVPWRPNRSIGRSWVLTRLHARYNQKSLSEDLVFKEATPISGGRGGGADEILKSAEEASTNTFQGRYIIRHPWEGAIECKDPKRGNWGHPPPGVAGDTTAKPAIDLAFAARGRVTLASMLGEPVPAAALAPNKAPAASAEDKAPVATTAEETPTPEGETKKDSGCAVGGDSQPASLLLMLLGLLALRPRRGHGREPRQ